MINRLAYLKTMLTIFENTFYRIPGKSTTYIVDLPGI
ncbi:hypothetical protein SAMN05518871_105231 [Psychrobacillus sp. OK028]|nr:hypothetical protein SAMN05518871_105231 [Psychrobacillus sp. OK028]